MRRPSFLASFLIAVTASALAQTPAPSIKNAQSLFERYVRLEAAFNPSVADLYADGALIKNKRVYPVGPARELTMPAPKYKELIRQSMPLAKERGDRSTYSGVNYTPEGSNIRITAVRFSELKKYSSPISLLVGPSKTGTWLILEELSESRP